MSRLMFGIISSVVGGIIGGCVVLMFYNTDSIRSKKSVPQPKMSYSLYATVAADALENEEVLKKAQAVIRILRENEENEVVQNWLRTTEQYAISTEFALVEHIASKLQSYDASAHNIVEVVVSIFVNYADEYIAGKFTYGYDFDVVEVCEELSI